MSQQHAHFEEESGGEPSNQISSAPRYEVPPWSSDQVEMPDHRLQARSLDRAQSTSSDLRVRTRFVLALMSLIFLFRSEEHTSELQSQSNLVCRLLLAKKRIVT